MNNNFNYRRISAYIKPKQYKKILEFKKCLLKEYNINIPITQLFRDSIDIFIDKTEKEGLKSYLEGKGW
ncbi:MULTISPECIES: hypothetical protein [Methanobacterium]|uniref:Uncharacterized protein n=1 Tax=Methanobacterium veterum TaxID=408577 RepID=A0A9E4ZXK4_9EURY|nr:MULTISPECIES: hypothetical protein [Methanobacterium]MCZ3367081.1 hypothetical protein [Methanobacterium veterum]MCZ3373771.1 hypothetical protein [Methanobacterium veterum]